MKYTNKHLKDSYKGIVWLLWISAVIFVGGVVLLTFGFVGAKKQMGNIRPLETVLSGEGNHANKAAYIEITKVPQKISEVF